jgi:aminoglycoside 2'-N-acetyltransferase I
MTEEDWEHALGGTHVVAEEDGRIVAHAAVVERTLHAGGVPVRTGYVEAVATAPHRQASGLGTRVMDEVGAVVREGFELGGLGTGAHHFYERLGWMTWPGPTAVRTATGLRRTPDEDGYIMVLRTSTTPPLDLHTTLSCDERSGDAW